MAFEHLEIKGAIWKPLGLSFLYLPELLQANVEANKKITNSQNGSGQLKSPESDKFKDSDSHAPSVPVTQPPLWHPQAVRNWPDIWQDQLKYTRKARLAWTYWNLGSDLLAIRGKRNENETERQERMNRLTFLKTMYRDIGLPPNTHTFWPLHFNTGAEGESAGDDVNIYWSGLKMLDCRGVIIMGSASARAVLGKSELKPLTHFMEKGILVWVLWDIDSFARKQENYAQMITYLKRVLRPFSPRD